MKLSKKKKRICNSIVASKVPVHLVVAGAGTGKSTLMRAAIEMERERNPDVKILCVAFANKTVERVRSLFTDHTGVTHATVHQIALKYIRDVAPFKFSAPELACLGRGTKIEVAKDVGVVGDVYEYLWSEVWHNVGDANAHALVRALNQAFAHRDPRVFDSLSRRPSTLLKKYHGHKTEGNLLDFNDMVGIAAIRLTQVPSSRVELGKYDAIYVDEAQDITSWQWEIIKSHLRPDTKLVLLGDPCQLAYGFLGARADFFDSVKKEFEGRIEVHHLSISGRCVGPICELSNAITKQLPFDIKTEITVSKHAPDADKPMVVFMPWDFKISHHIVEFCEGLHEVGYSFSDIVILFRTMQGNPAYFGLCDALKTAGIPYYGRGGFSGPVLLYQIVDALLSISEGKYEREDLRLLANLVARGDRKKATEFLSQWRNPVDPQLKDACRLLKGCREASWSERLEKVADVFRMYRRLDESVIEFFGELEDNRESWHSRLEEKFGRSGAVVISTIHSFKGDERKVVILADSGNLSLSESSESTDKVAELCLLNIAVTRAKERLIIFSPGSEYRGNSGLPHGLKKPHEAGLLDVARQSET